MANTQQGLSYALPPNSRILEKEHYKWMRSRNYRIWGSRCATIFGSGRKYAKGRDCKMPRKEPITLRADIYYLVWWSFSAWSSDLQLFTLCICHPLFEYLWKVDFVARFPSSSRFSGKTVAYQELFYVVTLTASSAQPKRRLKRDSKQATGVVSKQKLWTLCTLFGRFICRHFTTTDVVKLNWNGDTKVVLISTMVASSIPG